MLNKLASAAAGIAFLTMLAGCSGSTSDVMDEVGTGSKTVTKTYSLRNHLTGSLNGLSFANNSFILRGEFSITNTVLALNTLIANVEDQPYSFGEAPFGYIDNNGAFAFITPATTLLEDDPVTLRASVPNYEPIYSFWPGSSIAGSSNRGIIKITLDYTFDGSNEKVSVSMANTSGTGIVNVNPCTNIAVWLMANLAGLATPDDINNKIRLLVASGVSDAVRQGKSDTEIAQIRSGIFGKFATDFWNPALTATREKLRPLFTAYGLPTDFDFAASQAVPASFPRLLDRVDIIVDAANDMIKITNKLNNGVILQSRINLADFSAASLNVSNIPAP